MTDRAPAIPTAEAFDAYYFAHCCGRAYKRDGHWLAFFGGIADPIVSGIAPRSVLDAGCAFGLLVESLRMRGVDADGIDISAYAIEQAADPVKPYCRIGSVADEFARRYDLIVCIEVLEHMPSAEAEASIANFCRHTDDVLFSSTPGDHREPTHVNVRAPEYWAELFARHEFYRDVDFDASFVTPWAVPFRKSAEPLPRIVRQYERAFAALAAAGHDRRQFATELQREVGATIERLAAAERDRDQAHLQLDAERAAIAEVRATLTNAAREFAAAREALADADHTAFDQRAADLTIALAERERAWQDAARENRPVAARARGNPCASDPQGPRGRAVGRTRFVARG